MRPETRDKLLDHMESRAKWTGEKGYDEMMVKSLAMLARLEQSVSQIRSKAQLSAILDTLPEPSLKERTLILGVLKFLPNLMHYLIKSAPAVAENQLPALPRGRPAMGAYRQAMIVDYVSNHNKRGASLQKSKRLAAKRFAVSQSTIQRAWDDRADVNALDFHSVLRLIKEEIRSN